MTLPRSIHRASGTTSTSRSTKPVLREVESGVVRGIARPTHSVFYAIAYAAPPTGLGRFEEPKPRAAWHGVRDATQPGATAPQLARGKLAQLDFSAYFAPGWTPGSDYLTVNIWTPPEAPAYAFRQAPVLVFVHGGAFIAGSSYSPIFDGRSFARNGVIVVSVNYRLGLPGFLDIPSAHPNRGLADVLAALAWVRRNIAVFGGDPSNVTLAGHSAGAILTAAALASPHSEGLFHRAIMQSGSGTAAFTPEQAAIVREAAAKVLGVPPTLEGFAGLTDEELLGATPALMGLDLGTTRARDPLQKVTPLGVVLDEQPAVTAARGHSRPVDLLIGHNTEEGNLYLLPNGTMAATTPGELRSAAHYAHPDPDRLLSVYRARHPDATPGQLRSIVLGEAAFGAGSRALADAHSAAGHPTYAYVFNWRSTALAGQLGATHIVEAPFTFNTLSPELQGEGRLLGPTPAPQSLADQTHSAWIEFIKTGTPGWPRYELGQRTTMTIGDEWVPVSDPFAHERAGWTIT